jgi:hypothetical protein
MTIGKRIAALESKAPGNAGNWVINISGNLVWDPWDFPEPTEDEAAATLASLTQRMEATAERLRSSPDWREPTEAQRAEAINGFEDARERYQAEKKAVRATGGTAGGIIHPVPKTLAKMSLATVDLIGLLEKCFVVLDHEPGELGYAQSSRLHAGFDRQADD